jgi:hypothetical protein
MVFQQCHSCDHKFLEACGGTRKLNLPCHAHLAGAGFLYLVLTNKVKVLNDRFKLKSKLFETVERCQMTQRYCVDTDEMVVLTGILQT